jgi:hypothetical protein
MRVQITRMKREIFDNLDAWDIVKVARHQRRPQTLDYLELVFDEFVELHGDKAFRDDRSILSGFGKIEDRKVMFVGLKTVPPTDPFPKEYWGQKACACIGAYAGTESDGAKAMQPLLSAVPAPIFNWMGTMPLPAINALFDPFFPKGLQWYWKGDFVKTLPDEAIDLHIAHAGKAPSALSLMHLYPIDGAVRRVAPDATAWGARDATWNMVIAAIDTDPNQANALKTWGRDYWKAVHPFNMEGAYVNFLMDDEAAGRVQASYGSNYKRLAAVKAKYDPKNFFRVNQNIQPGA